MVQRLDVPALQQRTVFEVQWSDCPEDVYEEVARKLWDDMEFGNDNYYYSWDNEHGGETERYPVTAAYLEANNVKKCLIHWWW